MRDFVEIGDNFVLCLNCRVMWRYFVVWVGGELSCNICVGGSFAANDRVKCWICFCSCCLLLFDFVFLESTSIR